ncbi:MAG: AraC family transcriptional regulator [Pseudomonadota bacterium]
MSQIDRLSSLVSRFAIHTQTVSDIDLANMLIAGEAGNPKSLVLNPRMERNFYSSVHVLAALKVDFGGEASPVLDALPDTITIDLTTSTEVSAIAQLILSEIKPKRCGGQFALDKLCEFLMVNLLRNLIENRTAESGVLAGLAHPNLSGAIVAIHDWPGKNWRLDDFVDLSGMSRSQFMNEFQGIVGKSPMAYLKQWRMTLARNALLNGERVKETARKFGYGSGDAFTRAFTQAYGISPTRMISLDTRPQ